MSSTEDNVQKEQLNLTQKLAISFYRKRLLKQIYAGNKISKRVFYHFIMHTIFNAKSKSVSNKLSESVKVRIINNSWDFAKNHFKAKARRFATSKRLDNMKEQYSTSNLNLDRAIKYAYISELIELRNHDIKTLLTVLKIALEDNALTTQDTQTKKEQHEN